MQVLKTLNAGDSFGDFALDAPDSTSQKRSADARTKSPCILLTLAKTDYRRVTQQLKVMEYAERARWLSQCGAFESFSKDVLENIARRVTVKLFDAKSIIVKQDDDISEFCIVKSGVIEIFKYVPEGECCRRALKVTAVRDQFPSQHPTKLASINLRQQHVRTATSEHRPHISADDVYRPEAPGNWVLQRNWKDIENNRVYLGPSRQKRQLLAGVLGRGQIFGEFPGKCCMYHSCVQTFLTLPVQYLICVTGELAVLDPRPRSPVSALSLSTVALYTLNKQAIADLELKFHLPFVSFLNRSLTLHNPPYHKLAEYYRKWESWKSAKDKVLGKVMSETWMQARRQVMADLIKADTTFAPAQSGRGQCRHPIDRAADLSTVSVGQISPSRHARHNSTFRSTTTSKMAQHLLAALPKKPTSRDGPGRKSKHQLAPRHSVSSGNWRRAPRGRLEPLASRASRENIADERYTLSPSTVKN